MSLKIRRGTNSERLTIIPDEGELLYTVDTKKIFVGDGTTTGGSLVTGGLSGNLADNLYLDNHSIIGTNLIVNGQTGSISAASVTAHLRGSVYADDSTVLVDSIQGKVVGPIDVDVTSVRIAGGTSGQVLTTNGNGVISWSNKTNSLISLASLTDISFFNLRTNDTLKWNGNSWVNTTATSGHFDGDITGSVFADDSSLIINGQTKDANLRYLNITGRLVSTRRFPSLISTIYPYSVWVGDSSYPSGLTVYNDSSEGSAILIRSINGGAADGYTAGSLVWETSNPTKITSRIPVESNSALGTLQWRGWNGTDFELSSVLIAEVDSIALTEHRGNIFFAMRDIDGSYNRFNLNGNGTFSTKSAIIGDGGDISTAPDKTGDATLDIRGTMKLKKQTSIPSPVSEGMIAVADGNTSGWDPKGTNAGVSYPCYYNGSAWNPLY